MQAPANKATRLQGWSPEFNPWNSHKERKELTVTNNLRAATCAVWHMYIHTHKEIPQHSHIHNINDCIFKRMMIDTVK